MGALTAVGLLVLVVAAVAGPLVWGGRAATPDTDAILQGPSGAHPFGTDELGRDIVARTLAATRLSLLLSLGATALGAGVGVALGAVTAVAGRRVARLVNAGIGVLLAFPGILLSIFLAIVFGVGAWGALLALALAFAPFFARLTQTLAASVGRAEYVDAARVLGVPRHRLVLGHILPNIAEPLLLNVTMTVGDMLLSFAGLSFLGLGVQPPGYDWGRLLNSGLDRLAVSPLAALGPGVAIVFAAVVFNTLGELVARYAGGPVVPYAYRRPRRTAAVRATGAGHDQEPVPAGGVPVLDVAGLTLDLPSPSGVVTPVRGVDLTVAPGEIVGLVGESGSGKTLTALAVAGLVDPPATVRADRVRFLGHDLIGGDRRATRRLLGTGMALVYQNPGTSLNPALRIGGQLAEVARVHGGLGRAAAARRAVDRLRQVAIPGAARRARRYPHELSGGMKQRAVIAMGLMGEPHLLVADEPTTALDVTVQRQILRLLRRVNVDTGAAAVLISHDVAVLAQLCHRVLVMYAGRVVEELPVAAVRARTAAHPYTHALLAAVPDLAADRTRPLATVPDRPPRPDRVPPGCAFAPRCPRAEDRCRTERPELQRSGGRAVACWYPHPVPPSGAESGVGAAGGRPAARQERVEP